MDIYGNTYTIGNVSASGAVTSSGLYASSSNDIQLLIGTVSLFVSSSGNVGIGMTTPSARLYIKTDQIIPTNLIVENMDSGSSAALASVRANADAASTYIVAHGTQRVVSRYGVAVGGYGELLSSTGNGLLIGTATLNKPIIFGTNGAEVMRITGSNVIITGSITITSASADGYVLTSDAAGAARWSPAAAGGATFQSITASQNLNAGDLVKILNSGQAKKLVGQIHQPECRLSNYAVGTAANLTIAAITQSNNVFVGWSKTSGPNEIVACKVKDNRLVPLTSSVEFGDGATFAYSNMTIASLSPERFAVSYIASGKAWSQIGIFDTSSYAITFPANSSSIEPVATANYLYTGTIDANRWWAIYLDASNFVCTKVMSASLQNTVVSGSKTFVSRFAATAAEPISACTLFSGSLYAVAYASSSAGPGRVVANICSYDATTNVTTGSPYIVGPTGSTYISTCALTDSKFVVSYIRTNGQLPSAVICSASAYVITSGSAVGTGTRAFSNTGFCTTLTTSSFMMGAFVSPGTYTNYATVNDYAITMYSSSLPSTDVLGYINRNVATISSTKVFVINSSAGQDTNRPKITCYTIQPDSGSIGVMGASTIIPYIAPQFTAQSSFAKLYEGRFITAKLSGSSPIAFHMALYDYDDTGMYMVSNSAVVYKAPFAGFTSTTNCNTKVIPLTTSSFAVVTPNATTSHISASVFSITGSTINTTNNSNWIGVHDAGSYTQYKGLQFDAITISTSSFLVTSNSDDGGGNYLYTHRFMKLTGNTLSAQGTAMLPAPAASVAAPTFIKTIKYGRDTIVAYICGDYYMMYAFNYVPAGYFASSITSHNVVVNYAGNGVGGLGVGSENSIYCIALDATDTSYTRLIGFNIIGQALLTTFRTSPDYFAQGVVSTVCGMQISGSTAMIFTTPNSTTYDVRVGTLHGNNFDEHSSFKTYQQGAGIWDASGRVESTSDGKYYFQSDKDVITQFIEDRPLFAGIVQTPASASNVATIAISGQISTIHSGLITGEEYGINAYGELSTDARIKIGRALTGTQLLIY